MALVIEDGTGLSSATSYGTVEGARAYALGLGVTLSSTDSVVETQMRNAMDYLESLEEGYKGWRKWPPVMGTREHEQALAFPREGVVIDRYYLDSSIIPIQIVKAQYQLVVEQTNGVVLMPTGTGAAIKSEVIGPISTEYSTATSSAPTPILNKVDAILKPLMGCGYGTAYTFRS